MTTETTTASAETGINVVPALKIRGVPTAFLAFADVKRIVIHGGRSSHQDEQVAVALAVWAGADASKVERRDPTEEELQDSNVLVMDVGGQIDERKLNFDHHQLPRDCEATCAYSLIADFLGIRKELGDLFPWFEPGIVLDSKGPFALARQFGVEWAAISGMVISPSRTWHDVKWAEDSFYRESYTRWLANEITVGLDEYRVAKNSYHVEMIGGLRVLSVLGMKPGAVQDALIRARDPQVVIFDDDRGNGLGLLRINDDPAVDFSRLDGDSDVVFAHKGGFIAKTASKEVNLERLLAKAKV